MFLLDLGLAGEIRHFFYGKCYVQLLHENTGWQFDLYRGEIDNASDPGPYQGVGRLLCGGGGHRDDAHRRLFAGDEFLQLADVVHLAAGIDPVRLLGVLVERRYYGEVGPAF